MRQPSRKKIRRFLDVIEQLDRFDATQRFLRNRGADVSPPFPVPEVVEVIKWLKSLSNPNQVSD